MPKQPVSLKLILFLRWVFALLAMVCLYRFRFPIPVYIVVAILYVLCDASRSAVLSNHSTNLLMLVPFILSWVKFGFFTWYTPVFALYIVWYIVSWRMSVKMLASLFQEATPPPASPTAKKQPAIPLWLPIALGGVCVVLGATSVVFYLGQNQAAADLTALQTDSQKMISELQETVTTTNAQRTAAVNGRQTAQAELRTIQAEYNFWSTNAVVVVDKRYYHDYGCSLTSGKSFLIYNNANATALGYARCPTCFKPESRTETIFREKKASNNGSLTAEEVLQRLTEDSSQSSGGGKIQYFDKKGNLLQGKSGGIKSRYK